AIFSIQDAKWLYKKAKRMKGVPIRKDLIDREETLRLVLGEDKGERCERCRKSCTRSSTLQL
ncbi:MAG: hypothetical protein OCU22_00005, partial [Canidatus Methanoxibalbensis ujae]|nr:hypothetical protein [Candidatus Methanoxibalbensis ujae]